MLFKQHSSLQGPQWAPCPKLRPVARPLVLYSRLPAGDSRAGPLYKFCKLWIFSEQSQSLSKTNPAFKVLALRTVHQYPAEPI